MHGDSRIDYERGQLHTGRSLLAAPHRWPRCGRALRACAAVIGATLVLFVSAAASPAGPDLVDSAALQRDTLQRVTVIGDSVADALGFSNSAKAILSRGIQLDLQLAPCRRVGRLSCPHEGVRPPTVIELAEAMGATLGPTVVVIVGYNDDEDAYAGNIDEALAAFRAAGVTRVLWATLRAARHPYLTMNDAILAAASKHPELTVVEWNVYSRSHPEWFQEDGIHLGGLGADALATLVHTALTQLGIAAPSTQPPLAVATTRLRDARVGRRYSASVTAKGGSTPYRWTNVSKPPPGLALSAAGRLTGLVRAEAGLFKLRLRVRDASGASATVALVLRVRPSG